VGNRRIAVLGAGGFAREVRWFIEEIARAEHPGGQPFVFAGYVVSDMNRLTERDSTAEVVGDVDWLLSHRSEVDALAIGIGTPGPRLSVSAALEAEFPAECWPRLIHPSVIYDADSCSLGHGVILCPGTVMTVNVRIEPYAMVNFGSTVGHESTIGRGTVINPGANIGGGVELGPRVLVGAGAQVLQYLSVGEGATVGAGAVVTRSVGPGQTVVGVPARSQ